MRAREFITEASYKGNVGFMEVMKFYQSANEDQVQEFQGYMEDGDTESAWKLIQQVTGTKLIGKEFGDTDKMPKQLVENLRKWFKEKWVRFGPDGKIKGDCARGSDSEGKPKCLPQKKAHSLGKKGRASAASRKRRQDPNPERQGKAKNVPTKSTRDKK